MLGIWSRVDQDPLRGRGRFTLPVPCWEPAAHGAWLKMAFIVFANTERGSFRAEKPTRKDAVETAFRLLGQGLSEVVIIDEDGEGRTYMPSEFGEFFPAGRS